MRYNDFYSYFVFLIYHISITVKDPLLHPFLHYTKKFYTNVYEKNSARAICEVQKSGLSPYILYNLFFVLSYLFYIFIFISIYI